MNEFELIRRYFTRPKGRAALGVGDDCALIGLSPGTELAISTDMLVADRHFYPQVSPFKLGHKALAVNLSDLAAMGATPRWVTLAMALPAAQPEWLAAFSEGFFSLADYYDVELIGGDTTRGPLNLSLTILGEVPTGMALRRGGAHPGDDIWVSGVLGDAALALAHTQGRIRLTPSAQAHCNLALEMPQPRIRLGQELLGIATAAIDISDGLLGDLGHILEASGLGARLVLAQTPRSAILDEHLRGPMRQLALACLLVGGDDFELCFTAPPDARASIAEKGLELSLPVSCIGSMVAEAGLTIADEGGRPLQFSGSGFDHFASEG